MGSIRARPESGALFMDFKYQGRRLREQTMLPDSVNNRKRLQKVLERIETEIVLGSFDYVKTFGKELATPQELNDGESEQGDIAGQVVRPHASQLFHIFANQWFAENEVSWRRSYVITQRGALDKYVLPWFGEMVLSDITKADVLAFRAFLAKVLVRKSVSTLSNRRINAVMKPLRQILNEAGDRYQFNSAFRNIKPLRIKEVMFNHSRWMKCSAS